MLRDDKERGVDYGMIIHGDCIEEMAKLEENSIDSICSDPPYGLAFMGKDWDKFSSVQFQDFSYKWGVQALRVLKPGGYLLAFSGTRTYHRMVCGLEDAGFKIKDQLSYMYGSGFPKSLNISLAINKHLGGEVEQGNEKIAPDGQLYSKRKIVGNKSHDYVYADAVNKEDQNFEKLPTHPEALKWQGYGTALKPAFEPIVLAQKPYEKTYANNVLKWGVGGLNINASRIGYNTEKDFKEATSLRPNAANHDQQRTVFDCMDKQVRTDRGSTKGRFPSNVLLTHHAECVCLGLKEVKTNSGSPNIIQKKEDTFFFSKLGTKTKGYGNKQTVEAYNCHPNCPIRLLDEQSGITKSSKGGFTSKIQNNNRTHEWSKKGEWNTQDYINNANWHVDKGGASRFFYCGKAHKSERNAGFEGLYKLKEDIPKEYKEYFKPLVNDLATLKPISVMRYLVRLITPKGGTVLDPFGGSGTTGIACIIEGMNYILIEKRERFAKIIIPKRLEFWKDSKNWSILKDHNALPKVAKLHKEKTNRSLSTWL